MITILVALAVILTILAAVAAVKDSKTDKFKPIEINASHAVLESRNSQALIVLPISKSADEYNARRELLIGDLYRDVYYGSKDQCLKMQSIINSKIDDELGFSLN